MTIGLAGYNAAKLLYELDHATPANYRAKVGQTLADLITAANARQADLAAILASSNTEVLSNPTFAIKAGGSAVVKSTTAIAAMVGGALVRKAAATDMAALVGTLATAKSASWAFYIDASGTLTTSAKTADSATHDAALALVTAPPAGKAMLGIVTIDNATGSNFVGGTTALDTASLTVTYYPTTGSMGLLGYTLTSASVGALGSR